MTRRTNPIRDYYAGDSLTLAVTARNSDGSPLDLSGGSLEYGLSLSRSGPPDLVKTESDGIVVTDSTGGKFEVRIDPSDTDSLSGRFFHEVEFTDSSGGVSTLFVGDLFIEPSVL